MGTQRLARFVAWSVLGTYLLTGLWVCQQYGFSWDESNERRTGLVNTKYIAQVFHLDGLLASTPEVRTAPDLLDYEDNVYGSWFQVVATGIEILFKVQDFYDTFLLRHYLTFLIYFVGCVFLLRTLDLLFDNGWISLACLALFITQPRFFAEAFYNPKDIPFLSAVLIASYYVVAYLRRPSTDALTRMALATALAIATRVVGVAIASEVVVILFLDHMLLGESRRDTLVRTARYLATTAIALIVLWPFLWANPVVRFARAFRAMSRFHWGGPVLLNGAFIRPNDLPYGYVQEWMLVSVPEVLSALVAAAVVLFVFRLVRRESLFEKYRSLREPLFYFGLFLGPMFMVSALHSSMYDGWRHMYFVMSGGILCVGWALATMSGALQRTRRGGIVTAVAAIAIAVQSIVNVADLVRLHPYQNVYFNRLARSDVRGNYDVDYWGLSYREGLEFVLAHDARPDVPVRVTGHPDHLRFVWAEHRDRLRDTPFDEADYFLTNYRWHPGDFVNLADKEVYRVTRKGVTLMSVFKLR